MIRNFLFHKVNPQRDALWDPMDVALFEKCIRYISKKYDVVRIEDVMFTEKIDAKNEYATIMFDDGYKDNIQYAVPVLEKYNCKASFYVVTDCIDKNIPTWTYILDFLFQNTEKQIINIGFDFLPSYLKITKLDDKEKRINYASQLKPVLKSLSHKNRNLVLERVKEFFNNVEIPKIMMDWDDLRILKEKGHYIGSHTVSHSMLGTMNNENEIKIEMQLSAQRIEEELGHFPITISYPVGSFNETTKTLAKEAGYKIGLAVKQDIYNPKKADCFEISRIELYNEPWWKTKLRISNRLEEIKKTIKYR